MGTCTVKLPDEYMNQLKEFEKHTEDIIEKSLEAGAKIAYQKAKQNLNAVVGSGTKLPSKSTGQLQRALGISPVKATKDGYDIKVGFDEPRKGGKSNAMVANILEYGSRKHNQSPKPFMKPAEDSTKRKCKEEIERVFEEEASKYLGKHKKGRARNYPCPAYFLPMLQFLLQCFVFSDFP